MIDHYQEKETPEKHSEVQLEQPTETSQLTESEFYQIYKEAIIEKPINIFNASKVFQSHNIDFNPQSQFKEFNYEVIDSLLDFEVLKTRIFYGHFQFTVNILNVNGQNPYADVDSNQDGKYGLIYFYQEQGRKIAIKSFEYVEDNFAEVFQRVIREWSILIICSALKCGPKTENYLGFDIIVYCNCIQIAMQRGIKIADLNEKWYEDLKEGLETMHSYHIVHSDIKPQNIIFSPEFNKPVFIDFGFSDIIRQNVGLKKKSKFKGSPGFCSPEMLVLFSQKKHFQCIDLYYNDLYGLNATFKQYQPTSIFIKDCEKSPASSMIAFQEELRKTYFLYNFKFYYIALDLKSINLLFTRKDLAQSKIEQLMIFIINIFHNIFLPDVMNWLKDYCHTQEYRIIEKLRNLEKSKMIVQMKAQSSENTSETCLINYSKKFKFLFLKNRHKPKELANIQAYSQFLLMDSFGVLSKETQFDILLYCLRFNVKNISFQQKLKIARKWNLLLSKKNEQKMKASIDDICNVFQYLLEYCLQEPLSEWKKMNIFEIFYHLLMLGKDVLKQFHSFMGSSNKNYTTVIDRLMLKTDLMDLEDRFLSLDLSSGSNHYILSFFASLQQQIKNVASEINASNLANLNEEDIAYLSLDRDIRIIKKDSQFYNTNEVLLQRIKTINNKKIHSCFTRIVLERRIRFEVESNLQHHTFVNIRKIINSEDFENMDVHTLFNLSEIYLMKFELIQQFRNFSNLIKSIIDCDIIYQKFQLEKINFLLDQNTDCQELITKYLTQLNESYELMFSAKLCINRQLHYILSKIINRNFVCQNWQNLIKSLYHKFLTFKSLKRYVMNNDSLDFEDIMLRLQVQKLFMTLLPEYLDVLRNRISELQIEVKEMENKITVGSNPKNMHQLQFYLRLKFQLYFSQYYYSKETNNHENQLSSMLRIAEMAQLLNLKYIFDYASYLIIILSNSIIEESTFSRFILLKYNLAVEHRSAVDYLLTSQQFILNYTLLYFQKHGDQQRLLTLLKLINQWIQKNPLQPYILTYLKNLQYFYSRHPTFFEYNRLKYKLCEAKYNPYLAFTFIFSASFYKQDYFKLKILKIVALMLMDVTAYAKQQLLMKYHQIILRLTNISKHKIFLYFIRYQKKAFRQESFKKQLTRKFKVKFNQFCLKNVELKAKFEKII